LHLERIRENVVVRLLLFPIALLYSLIIQIRNILFDIHILKVHRFNLPIISVGNITVGGTGKTPMTMWLLANLKDDYENIAVVSRGYRRKSKGLQVVSDGRGNIMSAIEGGDEPVLIARKFPQCPVIVAEKRIEGVRKVITEYNPDLIILDDAFQHRWVQRNCDIVLINASKNLYSDHILPLGNLREPVSNLKRADIIIYTKTEEILTNQDRKLVDKVFSGPVFISRYLPAKFVDRELRDIPDIKNMQEQGVVACAGISDPNLFLKFLDDYKIEVKTFKKYPDHHAYCNRDIHEIIAAARRHSSKYVITTEKDIVKFTGFNFQDLELCALCIKIELQEPQKLRQIITADIDNDMKNA
jgi:tetraacyldisaccharide 4'-kinase